MPGTAALTHPLWPGRGASSRRVWHLAGPRYTAAVTDEESVAAPTGSVDAVAVAQCILGGGELRPGQREAIDAALAGDTIAVLATGTGKSLVYRVAGAVLGGMTVVICPTLALQMDQLAALRERGPAAVAINSSQTKSARRESLDAIARGDVAFALLAPEQTAVREVMDALLRATVNMFVVDEAHCIAAWGHDFRPDYLSLGAVARQLGRPPILALTATASPRTRAEIAQTLELHTPAVIVGEVDRPEIWLGARVVADEQAVDRAVADALRAAGHGEGGQPNRAIVYAQTRARAQRLCDQLATDGMAPQLFHGGLGRAAREGAHRDFHSGATRLIVGTNAFGLGVDRPDVRLVVHADAPGDLDSYYQEAGRAGRDGQPARALLVAHAAGFGVRRYFASGGGPSERLLRAVLSHTDGRTVRIGALAHDVEASPARTRAAVTALLAIGAVTEDRAGVRSRSGPDGRDPGVARAVAAHQERVEQQRSAVDLVRRYTETAGCRRRLILELLGEESLDPCGNCDNCQRGGGDALVDLPFPLGSTVRHRDWGDGVVEQYEADRVTVLFPTVGHKTLSLDLVTARGILA
jgi:ATP-dependent DNA helicase RecQ